MCGLVRFAIVFVLIAITFLISFTLKIKINKMVALIFVGITSVVISIFPVENAFCTFNSPESVYRYMDFQNTDVEILVEGESCDYVIGKTTKQNKYSTMVIPKNEKGWKIVNSLAVKERRIFVGSLTGYSVSTIQYKDDWFIKIAFLTPGNHKIESNSECDLKKLAFSLDDGNELCEYYGHITDPESYNLFIDGEEIKIFE